MVLIIDLNPVLSFLSTKEKCIQSKRFAYT